jgi:hypothetical protein
MELAKAAYPDAFPPPPTALDQALSAPKNILKGAGSGIVSAIGGLGALPYTGLRYFNPEMKPFAETGFGKKITETEQSLAPTDEGYGSQLSHGLGSFLSVFGPQAIARGFGTAGRLSTGLAPKAATPIAVAQTSGLGAEEARNRVEAARAEGKIVTPGEEFGSLVAGVPAGLTELLPVQNLFRATRGLDTGLTKGLQTAGFEGVKNFGKRALQQAGIEAAQEAGSGAIQDVIAQQIYNPEQEIGGSALKEAALGGGVGAIAQLGLDLALRKDIKMAYQISQKKKSDEDLAKQMEEVKAETAKKRAETDAALGISPLLALPAPKEQITPSQAKHPIYNPLGNFSEGDLDPANILAINAKRAEENKPKLKSFSIEDLADSGMSQADISGLVAKKTGYAGTEADAANIPQHINDVLSLAAEKNVDPNSQGFKDFLRRATGLDDLQGMSAPQLYSAYTAVYRLPDSATPQDLHPGTSATRFSEGQYDTTIKNLNAAHPEDNALTLDDTISQIKEHSGLKNDTDAESLMHTAIRRGDLFAKSYPAPDGTTSISVHVPNANKEAGPDIRRSSVESGIQPESYVIKSSAGAIEEHPTQDAADARVAALTVARQAQADRSLKEAAALSKETDKAQTDLDAMAARGESNTLAFQQKASEVAAKTQANQAKAETLNNTAASLVEPLVVEPKGQQITTKDVHTVYEGNQPIAAFDTAEKAQAHALSRLPEEELQKYTGKLGKMAQNELAQRQRKEPGISIIQTGGKEKAEEVLLSAGIFTGRFKQKAEELDRHLRPLMSRLGLGDLRLNIAHAIESGGADGKYAQKIISIALDAKYPIRVLKHEGIHALKELGFFTPEQWRILENKAKSEWVEKYNILERYADLNVDEQLEEAIADAFSDFDQTKPPAGLIGVLFNKLKTFMEALSNAIEGLGFDTHSSIFGRVSSGGEMAPIKPVITERVSVGRKREPVADSPEAPVEVAAPLPVVKPAIKTIETKGTAVRTREGKPEKVGSGAYKLVKDATGYKFKLLADTFEGEFSTEGKQPAQISSTKQISVAKPEPVAKEEESKPVVKVEKPTVNKSVKMKKLAKARKVILSADTMNEAIIKMGGINLSLRPDLTGDNKGNQNLPFVGSLFSKNGTADLSDLALNLGQYGYFTPEETEGVDGGARLLADRLRGEFDGGSPHQSMGNMDDAADAALYKRQEEEKELFEAAQAAAKKKGEEFYGAVSPDVLDVLGIPVTPEVLVNGELLARAIAISPEKVDDIATQYEGFVEGFNAAIAKFIKEQRNGGIQTDDGGEIFGDSEAGGTQVQGKEVPSTYEGEFTEITDKQKAMLSAPVSKLSEEQTVTLENHYGEDRNTPTFFARIQADVITFAAKGKQAISAAIRNIIAQIHAGVLAVAMIVNPSFVSQQNDVVVYSAPVVSEQLKVPAEAKTNMSDAALEAYEALYPKIKNDLLARDNFMLIMDKPNARMFVFNPDGSLFLQKKVLVGKDIGDLYTGTGKYTPAGLFKLGLRDAERSAEEAKTAGAYKHGKVFVLDKALGGEASVTILHSVWTKEKDAQQRVAALKKEGGEDSRYSFGCINVDADTYNGLVTRNLKQMDGASLFIVPDNQKQVKEFLAGTNVKDSLTRAKFSRRQTETPAFKQWFGKSKAVNADGTPKIFYHGTARDIGTFKPKRSGAIFLTDDPEFASGFASLSKDWMKKRDLKGGENIMPLYIRAENPFDYENPKNIETVISHLVKKYPSSFYESPGSKEVSYKEKLTDDLARGRWTSIEDPSIQEAIKETGFDSFYVEEAGRKNLAVYKENQVKSAVGNTGAFSRSKDDVRYSRKVDRLKATGSSKAWIFFSEANKGINFTNIKTLAEAGEAAEEHYKDQIKNIPEFDGKAYMEGLTIGDINAYPPDIQHAIQEYKAGNKSKGIQEILDTVASQRKANIKEWKKYIENINPAMEKDPFWRDYVISSLLKSMRTDKPDTGLPLNANALGQLYQKFKQGENINFGKGYQSALVDATKDLVELGDATTGWRKIPQTDKNDPKFDERVAAVQSLSCTGWCTRSTMAAPYIQKGDFWVYVDDKKPQVAIRFEGDQVQEIQGPQNDRSIPTKYINEITSLVDSGKIKNMTGKTKGDITKAVRKSQFEAMIKERLASGELVEKDRGYAKKNGIELDGRYYAAQGTKVYVDADGGIVVNDDVTISEAAPNLKAVGGNAYMREGASVPNLTTVGGDAYINYSAPKLTTVGGDAYISEGASAPALTTVGGDADIRARASVPALTAVGGDASIYDSVPALTTVGGDADIRIRASVPALTAVGGNAYIRIGVSVPALTAVGGNAYINYSAPKLTTVGGDVFIDRGGSAPALTTVGGDAGIYGSAPNIKRKGIGKEAALKGTALGKDEGKFSRRAGYAPSVMQGAAQPMSALDEAVNRTTTVRKTAGLAQRVAEAISPTGFTRFRQAFINKYEAIENLTRDVAKKFGDAESFADVSAIAAALFSDRAAGVAASSFMNGIPKYQNGFTKVSDEVRGLIPILEPLMKPGYPQNILQLFQFYAGTRRGSRLLYEQKMDANGNLVSTSREYNFTKEDIALGNSLERQYPEFKTVFAEYQQYNNGLVQFMKDTGVISAKEAELWTKNWDYIPFYRQMDGERISAPSIFSSIAGVTKPKELKGGEAPLADFLETVVRNARAAIEAGMKNVAGQRVVRDIVKIGQGQEVPAGTAGLDIVTVKQEGVTKYYKVNDPLLVESLRGLNLPNLPFVDILAAPANFLRSMVTKDPGYMMANMVRDSMQAWVTSGANITPILDTFKQYGKVISGRSPEAKALSDAGLFSGYDFSGDTKSSAKEVEKELRKRTGKRTILQTALLPGAKVWEMLDKGSHASDVATRAEIYKRTMETTGGNEAEALYQALEIMNFSRKGNSALIRIITALVPFMNARIQGIDVLYRTGFGKSATANREAQQKAFITRSMTIFALSVMYWMLASDTEEYKTATQEERDNNWIFGGAKIPIPFELGVMFKVFPERMLEYFFGTDTGEDLKKSAIRNLTSTLVMNPIPHAFVPIIEHVADYSFFTGQEIVGKGMEGLATRYQAQPGTSLLAKTVGKETGASPVVLDNYIRGYTGTIGTYIVMAIDAIMHGEGDDIKASKRLEQMPVFRRFMSNKLGSGTVNAYYDLKKEVETSTRTINYLERQGRMEDMAEYLKGRGGKLQTIKPYIQELEKDMDGLRDFRRDVRIAKIPADRLAEIEDAIRVSEINLTRNIQTIKKAIE